VPNHHRPADRDQFRRDTIAAWKSSGQTIRAFCAGRRIGQATFSAERRAFAGPDRGVSSRSDTAHDPSPLSAGVRVIPDGVIEVLLRPG
jgi:hypothetical protein